MILTKRILLVVLGILILSQPVMGQWSTNTITPPTDNTPQGVTVETHPLTNTWVVAYAAMNSTRELSQIRILSSFDAWNTNEDVFHWADVRDETNPMIGGLSTSYAGMSLCSTHFFVESGTANAELRIHWQNGNDFTDWNHALFSDDPADIDDNNRCDTALPRYGWRTPPSMDLMWITNQSNPNNVVYASLGPNGDIITGREATLEGGDLQINVDSAEHLISPGSQYEPTWLIRDNIKEPSEKCAINLWWLGCQAGKAFDAWIGFLVPDPSASETQSTVDWHSRAIACGVVQGVPNDERGVFSLENSFLNTEVSEEEKLASGDTAIDGCGVAALDHWSHLVMWQHPENGIMRIRETSLGSPFPTQEAFTHENKIFEIQVKAVDQDRSGQNLVGAFRDNQSDVYGISSDDRGRTWNVSLVATDWESNDFGGGHGIDVAYDRHREKQLVVYQNSTNVILATRDLTFSLPPVRASQDLRGLFEEPSAGSSNATFLGIDLEPNSEATGWTTTGTSYFLAFLLMYALMAGIWVHTKNPLMSLLGGGGLGLLMAFAFGAIEFWVIFVLGILVAGGILFLSTTFSGIGGLGGGPDG